MKIEAYIQARMGSTRLPGKVLKPVLGRPLLSYLLERLRDSKELSFFTVLTTTEPADDEIVDFCKQNKISVYRGSEEDVLERYYEVAKVRKPDAIVRITADCPLIDPEVLDEALRLFRQDPSIDYLSNSLKRSFPRGLDIEVFKLHALKKAFLQGHLSSDREHVTPYIYQNPEIFHLKNLENSPSLADERWTVDTPEDFALIEKIIEGLYPTNKRFRMQDILDFLDQHPELRKLNADVQQKHL